MKHLSIVYFCIIISSACPANSYNFAHNIHKYTWANYQAFSGNKETAHQWYRSIFSSFGPVYNYKGYIHFLFQNNQYTQIAQLMNKLSPHFSHDADIQRIFAISLQQTGKSTESDALFISLARDFPADADIAFNAVNSYLRMKEPNNALAIIDSIIHKAHHKSYEFIFYFLKAQTYLQLSKKNEAKDAIQQCLEINPRFDRGWLLFALLLEQEGNISEAIKGFTAYLSLTKSAQKDIEQHVLDLILQQKKLIQKHSSLLLRIHSFDIAAHYIYALQETYALMHSRNLVDSLYCTLV